MVPTGSQKRARAPTVKVTVMARQASKNPKYSVSAAVVTIAVSIAVTNMFARLVSVGNLLDISRSDITSADMQVFTLKSVISLAAAIVSVGGAYVVQSSKRLPTLLHQKAWVKFKSQYDSDGAAYDKLVYMLDHLQAYPSMLRAWLAVGAKAALGSSSDNSSSSTTSERSLTWLLQPHQHGAAGAMLKRRNILTLTPARGKPQQWEIKAKPAVTSNHTRHPFIQQVYTSLGHLVGFVCLQEGSLCFVRAAVADSLLAPYLTADGLWQSTDAELLRRKAAEVDYWLGSMSNAHHFDLAAQGLQFLFRNEPFYKKLAARVQNKRYPASLSLTHATPGCQAAFEQVFDGILAQASSSSNSTSQSPLAQSASVVLGAIPANPQAMLQLLTESQVTSSSHKSQYCYYDSKQSSSASDKQGFCWLCNRLLKDASVLGPKCTLKLSSRIHRAFKRRVIKGSQRRHLLELLATDPQQLQQQLVSDTQLQPMLEFARQHAARDPDSGDESDGEQPFIVSDDGDSGSEIGEECSDEEGDWDSDAATDSEAADSEDEGDWDSDMD